MTSGQAAVELAGVAKSYGATPALSGVEFAIDPGRIHALLGGNGSGKSTLIKILAGVVSADAGTVVRRSPGGEQRIDAASITPAWSRANGFRFVHQDVAVIPDMSVTENLALGSTYSTRFGGGVDWRAQRMAAQAVLDRFELDCRLDDPVGALPPSGQTLLAIARALQDDEDPKSSVLILDEPTAALPRPEVAWLLQTIRRFADRGQTIVLVSHRLDEVVQVADVITVLRDGRHLLTEPLGDRTSVDLAELIVGHKVARTGSTRVTTDADVALQVEHVTAGPVDDLNMFVRKGEVVGLVGQVGSGRSSVLRAVYGLLQRTGRVTVAGSELAGGKVLDSIAAGVRMLPERRSEIALPGMEIAANISGSGVRRFWKGYLDRSAERRAAQRVIDRYKVVASSARAPIASLSGGNQQKVLIGAAMADQPRVLLLDEPSQGVDIGARRDIHESIHEAAQSGTAVIVVSSDLEEVVDLCDRVLVMTGGKVTDELVGTQISESALARSLAASPTGTRSSTALPTRDDEGTRL